MACLLGHNGVKQSKGDLSVDCKENTNWDVIDTRWNDGKDRVES